MAKTSEEWKEIVKAMLIGINRYNPEIQGTLEDYVSFQSQGDCYDFEANLTLLKLYQFNPTGINRDVAAMVLLKALTQLPKTDFVLLKCILAFSLQTDDVIKSVIELHSKLECCQFKSLWDTLEEAMEIVNKVTLFKEAIRKYICSVLDVSYQSIPLLLLQEYLGGLDKDGIDTLVAENGWGFTQDEGGACIVTIRNQETTIKPKKILSKIEFDNISGILSAAANR